MVARVGLGGEDGGEVAGEETFEGRQAGDKDSGRGFEVGVDAALGEVAGRIFGMDECVKGVEANDCDDADATTESKDEHECHLLTARHLKASNGQMTMSCRNVLRPLTF